MSGCRQTVQHWEADYPRTLKNVAYPVTTKETLCT